MFDTFSIHNLAQHVDDVACKLAQRVVAKTVLLILCILDSKTAPDVDRSQFIGTHTFEFCIDISGFTQRFFKRGYIFHLRTNMKVDHREVIDKLMFLQHRYCFKQFRRS